MAHRTQLTLTDEQYARLQTLSRATGLSLSELVRRAVDRSYAAGGRAGLERSFGSWKGRRLDGEGYVERMRSGLARRLEASLGSSR